jgi:hypothetical protein
MCKVAPLILLLAITASAQELKKPPAWNWSNDATPGSKAARDPSTLRLQQLKNPPSLWNWSDATMLGSMFADELSTSRALSRCPTCSEAGLNLGPRLALKAGAFGFFKAWEYKKPEDRKKIRLLKLALSGVFVGVSVNNMMRGR